MINKGDILICKRTHQGFIKNYHYNVYNIENNMVYILNESSETCSFYGYDFIINDNWRTWYLWNTFYKISELRKLKLKQIIDD